MGSCRNAGWTPYRFASSLAELQAAIDGGIGYPCVVKPVMSSSGKGQSKVDRPADVKAAYRPDGLGAIVNSSRGVTFPFHPDDPAWEAKVVAAASKAAEELRP